MRSFEYLADGHHVDDAGNLISCTYVDFRDPAARSPITTLQKASSKRHAIPGCGTIRISKPSCFLGRGEGLAAHGGEGEGDDESGTAERGAGPDAAPADTGEATDEACYSRNGWIYCASIEPETPGERSAWREAPPGYDAVSPIRRPRAFARALGPMAAEQAGPRGRTVLLRNTLDGEAFSAAHRSQMVYHGPVVYSDDPYRRMERCVTNQAQSSSTRGLCRTDQRILPVKRRRPLHALVRDAVGQMPSPGDRIAWHARCHARSGAVSTSPCASLVRACTLSVGRRIVGEVLDQVLGVAGRGVLEQVAHAAAYDPASYGALRHRVRRRRLHLSRTRPTSAVPSVESRGGA